MDTLDPYKARIQSALLEISQGVMPYKEAAETYRVGVDTLYTRLYSTKPYYKAYKAIIKLFICLE